jgi:glycosyltransferase involved in cell wall biosynthesis
MAHDARKTDQPFPKIAAPVYLSVGHTAHAKEHTGIQRVTRSLARELQASGLKIEFIEWVQAKRRYVVLDDPARRGLAREGGPFFEPVESLFARVMPEASWHLPPSENHDGSSETIDSSISEERIIRFESIVQSIRHPIPGVPRLIDYLPIPRSARRGLRRGLRHSINRIIRWRDRKRIRSYIREIVRLRRAHNRLMTQVLKLSEMRRESELRLTVMERNAWLYKQRRDGLACARNELNSRPSDEPSSRPPPDRKSSSEDLQDFRRQEPGEADLFSLTHRLQPTRFKPVKGSWVVVPELMRPEEMRDLVRYCRRHRLNLAVLFHDAIAVTHPELVSSEIRRNHAAYIRYLCRGDLVAAVSRQSADELKDYADRERLRLPRLIVCSNGASFPGERPIAAQPTTPSPIRAICVGTIDPRKNHTTLLEALDLIKRADPTIDLHVTLIGHAYPGSEDLARKTLEACRDNPILDWNDRANDEVLVKAYRDCHFTVFPSVIEGFGLPVLESLWHGRPCICSATGAVGERATGGGCATVDVTNPEDLAGAILRMVRDPTYRQRLTNEANSRVLKTWREQAIDLIKGLNEAVPRYQFPNNKSDRT